MWAINRLVTEAEAGYLGQGDAFDDDRPYLQILDAGTLVDEQWLLDLERRHFMALLATGKTQDRIEYMLKNGKPLRN